MAIAASGAYASDGEFQKLGVYVVVSDVERSVEFYTRVFDKRPYINTGAFAAFDVAGGAYALFATRASDVPRSRGNNTVPYIRVRDAHHSFARLATLKIAPLDQTPLKEGPITLFRFLDPDGNTVEFYSLEQR